MTAQQGFNVNRTIMFRTLMTDDELANVLAKVKKKDIIIIDDTATPGLMIFEPLVYFMIQNVKDGAGFTRLFYTATMASLLRAGVYNPPTFWERFKEFIGR